MITKYFIADNHGNGLHYIRGNLFWASANTVENLEEFTSFETYSKAKNFIEERLKPLMSEYQWKVGKITFSVEIL